MPWDPKPVQQAPPPAASSTANGLPPSSYNNYDSLTTSANGPRVKYEPGADQQYNGLPNGYGQNGPQAQGGIARAQQLVQQQYGAAGSASINAMQRGGLALPGQQQQQARPQGLQLPGQPQPQFSAAQQQAMYQRQQQQLQQQQQQPRIKTETQSPQLAQSAFQQQANYGQTDGADDAYEQWQQQLAQRRAASAEQMQQADRFMRDQLTEQSIDLQSGLMLPLDQQPSNKRRRVKATPSTSKTSTTPSIPQMDGGAGDEDEEEKKAAIKDEDDENAINSDLDDSDEDALNAVGEDDDDDMDSILCTYDKVQRVKNKWKCTLKDGVMSVNGKEWVFHKGTGEFEW
jgi:transcription initiation factor TFIIA large subunit